MQNIETCEQPVFITERIDSVTQMNGIARDIQGGDYMPAVTYHQALAIMSEHGDEVLEYIDENCILDYCTPDVSGTWANICSWFLSVAIQHYAQTNSFYEFYSHSERGESCVSIEFCIDGDYKEFDFDTEAVKQLVDDGFIRHWDDAEEWVEYLEEQELV